MMAGMNDRSHLLTEQRLPESMRLDAMSVGEAVGLMNRQDAAAVAAGGAGGGEGGEGGGAGGTTPFVHGALLRARERGAKTVFLSCVQRVPGEPDVDVAVRPLVGPEVV